MCIVRQKFTKTLNLAAKHKADLLKSLCMLTHLNHAKDVIVADRTGDEFISLGIWCFVCAKRRISTQSRPSRPHFLPRVAQALASDERRVICITQKAGQTHSALRRAQAFVWHKRIN
jgi:hypothetical protein